MTSDTASLCCTTCDETYEMIRIMFEDHQRLMQVITPYLDGSKELPIPPAIRTLLGI